MNTLYLITGPAGVGKSAVSKKLAENLKKSVLIEGDEIYHQVISGYVSAWMPNNHLDLFWKNVKSLIKNSLDSGYDVIFNYIINKKDYEILKEEFKEYKIIFKVLITDEKELLKRDAKRPSNCMMRERCIILLNQFKEEYKDTNYLLYTSNLSIDDVVKKVMIDAKH